MPQLWDNAAAKITVAGQPHMAAREQAIEFAPLSSPQRVPFTGTDYQAVRLALLEMWGPRFPIRLSRSKDVDSLRAMVCAAGQGSEPYQVLHDALVKYGEIEVRDV